MRSSPLYHVPGRAVGYALLALLACLVILAACDKSPPPPEVVANGETLRGEWDGDEDRIAVFRGIPFAAPPLGELRWRSPRAHSARSGTQDATDFAPACSQGRHIVEWYDRVAAAFGHAEKDVNRPTGISEDCLYLNIWTPQVLGSAGLPVMVYVHGGSNKGGWSYEPNYQGEQLAARGVVVVSIAYRVGPLGFFSHPALAESGEDASANFGLLDIVQAFRWVKENIGAFGGDPANITGFGESAGAGNLLVLALTGEDEEGLFRRIIAQSAGSPLDELATLAELQVIGQHLAMGLGMPGNVTAAQLRGIAAQQLVESADAMLPNHQWAPVLDGRLVSLQPMQALQSSRAGELDLIIGSNADEWYMYIDPGTSQAEIDHWVRQTVPEYSGSLLSLAADYPEVRRAMDRLRTAKDILCPAQYIAATVSSRGGQGFNYYFSRQRSGEGGMALGVYHGAELPYVFNRHDDWLPTEELDLDLTEAMMNYWTSFAANGSPQATNHPGWPVYTDSRQYVMELGDSIRIVQPADRAWCRYLGPQEH